MHRQWTHHCAISPIRTLRNLIQHLIFQRRRASFALQRIAMAQEIAVNPIERRHHVPKLYGHQGREGHYSRKKANILREILTNPPDAKANPFDSPEIKEVMDALLKLQGL
jgi:hypothetical protein